MVFDPRKCWFSADDICLGNHTPAGVITVKAVKADGFTVEYNGKEIDAYTLEKVNPHDAGAFQVWRLPCAADAAVHSFLDGNNAACMVTATFSGCTFGLGTRTQNGGVLVTHANAISANGGEAQRNAQAQLTRDAFTAQDKRLNKMIEPAHYRTRRDSDAEWRGAQDKAIIFGLYGTMEGREEQQRGLFKHALLSMKHAVVASKPRWRFYQTRFRGDGGYYKVIELAKRIDRV